MKIQISFFVLSILFIVLCNNLDSQPSTNTPVDFNSRNIEYVDNVHSLGEYSREQARNQPFIDKIIRCFKIFFLKQYENIETQIAVDPVTSVDEAVTNSEKLYKIDTFNYEEFKKQNH